MCNNDLPGTVDDKPVSVCGDALQSTTAPATEASQRQTAGLDLRGYKLMDRLGGGGMGDVYRAGDPALGRDLAVKVMKADLQGYASAEQRFLREAQITGSLQHPGIVPIHNLGRLADGRLHYTMRLVRGRTLSAILREEAGQTGRLPTLLTIFEKVCQAVAYAHSKQVLHRDLKPANVMVGRFGEVQVMDWGLAKLLTAGDDLAAAEGVAEREGTRIQTEVGETPLDLTQLGREMGTPAYMPPEQALGEWDTVDERADVFALGAMLYEILTGRPPYSGRDSIEVLQKAKRGDLGEALARLEGGDADATLLELCRKCLAPAREGRPRDAEQVAQRVAAYQAEVQERLRGAELQRSAAVIQAREERKKRRWIWAAVAVLLAGMAGSTWQAVRATKAESVAQTRLGQIEKANDVLTAIFRDLDPRVEEKGGPSLRQQLSQHLERAAMQLDEAAVGEPVIVARLQATLGKSLMNLGQPMLAIELLIKAGMALEAKLGPDHTDTLACRGNLATAYQRAGLIADAIRLNEHTLKQLEDRLGPDHPDTLQSRNNLAVEYQAAGRPFDAIHLLEQTLKQKEIKLGTDHPDTLLSRNNLAMLYLSVGRTADAIGLLEQTLKQREAKLGPEHLDTLTSRNNLANAYWNVRRTTDAIRLFEQTLKQREAKLGPDHPDTLASRHNLATTYRATGRITDAIRLHEQTFKRMEAKLGPDHPDTLQSRNNLANAYLDAGRSDEAIRLHKQILKQREAKLGSDHPETLQSMASVGAAYRSAGRLKEAIPLLETALQRGHQRSDGFPARIAWVPGTLARAYEQAGQFAKAESIYRDALEKVQKQIGSDDPRTADALSELGLNLLKQKKFSEAEPLLRQWLTIRDKKQPDDWTTFFMRSALGAALSGQHKHSEAEPLLVQGYEGVRARQDKIPPAYRQLRLTEALERLVQLYEATNQSEKAADRQKELQKVMEAQKQAKP